MDRTKLKKALDISYDDALTKIPDVLKQEGFSVLPLIDLGEVLKNEPSGSPCRYTIFAALIPSLAHRALSSDPDVGVLLPCNVAVWEREGGKAVVAIMDPLELVTHSDNAALREIAAECRTKLGHALFRLG